MISMSQLYSHQDYSEVLLRFKTSNHRRRWKLFSRIHLVVSNQKCPICECSLKESELQLRDSNNGQVTVRATIDHYRPQRFYSFLTYFDENYILMCSECNNIYKGNSFPLYNGGSRATSITQLVNEKPLLVNPITDDVYDLFVLNFTLSPSGRNVLELIPKHQTGYRYHKAIETIRLFGLGDCEVTTNVNQNIRTLRVNLLHSHFKKFEGFVKAFQAKDVSAMRDEIQSKNLDQYGFLQFILSNHYNYIVPNRPSP